jgi:hypothetical protein
MSTATQENGGNVENADDHLPAGGDGHEKQEL